MEEHPVLIVDDDTEFSLALKDTVEDLGYSALRAEHGRAALKILEHVTPSLLLIDLFMPVMNGRELLRMIKLDAKLATVPRLIMTAANDPMLGVKEDVSVLYKPIDIAGLVAVLKKYAQKDPSSPV